MTLTVRYRDSVVPLASAFEQQLSFVVEKNIQARVVPVVSIDRSLVFLDANYLGEVLTNESETVTVSVAGLTYDADGDLDASSFRISVMGGSGATVTNNDDGTVSVTNLPDNQDTANVTLEVMYRDAVVPLASLFTENISFVVEKRVANRDVPTPMLNRSSVALPANHLGVVSTSSTQANVITQQYDESSTSFLPTNDFNFRNGTASGATVLTGAWPTTGTVWLRLDPSGANETALLTALGVTNPSVAQDLSGIRLMLSDGTNEATYGVTRYEDAGTDEILRLDVASEVVAGTPQDGTNYNFSVITGEGEQTVTVDIPGYAYDNDGELGANSYRVSLASDGGASVTIGADGAITVTNLPDNQLSAEVTVTVTYRDDVVSAASAYTQNLTFTVEKNFAAPPVIVAEADPATVIFNAGSTSTAQVVTITVTEDDNPLTFITETNLGAEQWRIDNISATPNIGVVNNNDGTLNVASPSNESGSFVVTIQAQDSFGSAYTRTTRINYSQVFEAVPDIELTFSDNTAFVQNTDGTFSHSSVDAGIRVFLGDTVVARTARRLDFNTTTGAFSINATNPAHPDGNLNPTTITVTLVNGGEFQVEYTE